MAELRRGFEPPPEVTSYFEGKALKPRFSWLDVWGEEHAYAFTVAKATELELLTSFRDSIAGAIREGKGFETWRKEMLAELRRLGWAKPRMVSDPDGIDPDRMVNFASPRRLKTIFWSNVNSARSAGQWERAQRTKRTLPYILYVRTTSSDPRQEHLGWVGIILAVDDPFWRTHWPPNGWGCKCQVRQITAREAERLLGRAPGAGGIFYRDTPPDLGPDIPHRNRRTGEVTMVPPGIDPGWHTNPGLARARTLMKAMSDRLDTAGPADAASAVADFWMSKSPAAYIGLPPTEADRVFLPAAVAPKLTEAMGATGKLIAVSTQTLATKLVTHGPQKKQPLTIEVLADLPAIMEAGEITQIKGRDLRLTSFFKDRHWRIWLRKSASGFLRITTMHRTELAKEKE